MGTVPDFIKHLIRAPLQVVSLLVGALFVCLSFARWHSDRGAIPDFPVSPCPWLLLVGVSLILVAVIAHVLDRRGAVPPTGAPAGQPQALGILAGVWHHVYGNTGGGETPEVVEITTDGRYLVRQERDARLPSPEHRYNIDVLLHDPGTGAIALAKRNPGGGLHGVEALRVRADGTIRGANYNALRSDYRRL